MVDLTKALENLKFDTRMKEWMVKHGVTTKEELAKNVTTLQDSKEQCEQVTLEDKPDFGD